MQIIPTVGGRNEKAMFYVLNYICVLTQVHSDGAADSVVRLATLQWW
jgi:hypothetical protein